MSDLARWKHAELLLAAIRCEAQGDRLRDKPFRNYVTSITENLDLPDRDTRLAVIEGGRA